METLRQKAQNATKIVFILTIFLVFIPRKIKSQVSSSLTCEQHSIISSVFRESNEDPIFVYFMTIRYEKWMSLVWDKDFMHEDGIAFCNFDVPELKEAFKELRYKLEGLYIKSMSRNMLDNKFKLRRNSKRKDVLFISEPLIIGKYSFVFYRVNSEKGLWVQKVDNGIWNYECAVPLEFELH